MAMSVLALRAAISETYQSREDEVSERDLSGLLSVQLPDIGTGARRSRKNRRLDRDLGSDCAAPPGDIRLDSEVQVSSESGTQDTTVDLSLLPPPPAATEQITNPGNEFVDEGGDDPWAEVPIDPEFDAAWERWFTAPLPEDTSAADVLRA